MTPRWTPLGRRTWPRAGITPERTQSASRSCRPGLHSDSGGACHCQRVAASRHSDAWNHNMRTRKSAQGICSSTPPVALPLRVEPVYVSCVEVG